MTNENEFEPITIEDLDEKLHQYVERARKICGCYNCQGMMEIGAHTIATPDKPRRTPSSCLAREIFLDLNA